MRQRSDLSVEGAATAEGIPVAPDMTEPRVPIERAFIDKRVVLLCLWSVVLAVATGFIAQGLVGLIGMAEGAAAHGGRLVIERSGHGYTVRLWLPACPPSPRRAS